MLTALEKTSLWLAKCACGKAHRDPVVSQRGLWFAKEFAPADEPYEAELRGFIAALRKIIGKQVDSVVARLRESGATGRTLADQAALEMTRPEWGRAVQTAANQYVTRIVEIGGEAGLAVIPSPVASFNMASPNVTDYVRTASTRLAEDIRLGTTSRVSDLLADHLDDGDSIADIADSLSQRFGFDAPRAETIARTESARAYTEGNIEGWEQSGVVVGKRFVLAADACPVCVAVDSIYGGKTIPLRTPFFNVGDSFETADGQRIEVDYAPINGGIVHPRCRCSIEPVLEGEE